MSYKKYIHRFYTTYSFSCWCRSEDVAFGLDVNLRKIECEFLNFILRKDLLEGYITGIHLHYTQLIKLAKHWVTDNLNRTKNISSR